MRLVYWLLGTAAAGAAAAYVANRSRKNALAISFLTALANETPTIVSEPPSIEGPGLRGETFRGELSGRWFVFSALHRTADERWTFVLTWDGGATVTAKEILESEGEPHPLQEAYRELRRRTSETDASN